MQLFTSLKVICIFFILHIGLVPCAWTDEDHALPDVVSSLKTPLEADDFQRLTTETGRSDYLRRLCSSRPTDISIELRIIGHSFLRKPIEAVVIGAERQGGKNKPARVLLIGSQHGSEPSGCEALLALARNIMFNPDLRRFLDTTIFMIVPAANPDGLAANKRVNGQGVNLSTDFGRLEAPESAAIQKILNDFQPDIVLDIHESALLKKQSLGKEGFLTDFECQFDFANNPNVFDQIRKFSADILLPDVLQRVNAEGLTACRYIGEITRTDQVITHGGLSAHNLRNKAGLSGAFSFVLENRLDPSTGAYPTPRNIRERMRKQLLSIRAFLQACNLHLEKIRETTSIARGRLGASGPVWLIPNYVHAPDCPHIEIPLRRIDTGNLKQHRFVYHRDIDPGPPFMPPPAYRIESQTAFFREWLEKQGIVSQPCPSIDGEICIQALVESTLGRYLPLYLEAESSSTILNRLPFSMETIRIQRDYSVHSGY